MPTNLLYALDQSAVGQLCELVMENTINSTQSEIHKAKTNLTKRRRHCAATSSTAPKRQCTHNKRLACGHSLLSTAAIRKYNASADYSAQFAVCTTLWTAGTNRIAVILQYNYQLLENNNNYYFDCSDFLNRLSLTVPHRSVRFHTTFYISMQHNNYTKNSPLSQVMRLKNIFKIDLFNYNTQHSFKRRLNNVLHNF